MTVIPGPVEFLMGSPTYEPDHFEEERLHRRRIGRSFAIASKPVTVAQFQRFLAANPEIRKRFFDAEGQLAGLLRKYSPADEGPIILVDWYTAAAYCNWLSAQEGIPKQEWCYGPGPIRAGMTIPRGYLSKTGYRLPTEAEWEYACRAGAITGRYYGNAEALLPRYAWYLHDSPDRTWPVGQKRPNDFGLFDMHGNVWQWCQEGYGPYPAGIGDKPAEDTEDIKDITDSLIRVLRGASFRRHPQGVRSACRAGDRPARRDDIVGLRIARTYR
jgi:formylglycine-generating enzyme required for sulfatase activity